MQAWTFFLYFYKMYNNSIILCERSMQYHEKRMYSILYSYKRQKGRRERTQSLYKDQGKHYISILQKYTCVLSAMIGERE